MLQGIDICLVYKMVQKHEEKVYPSRSLVEPALPNIKSTRSIKKTEMLVQ